MQFPQPVAVHHWPFGPFLLEKSGCHGSYHRRHPEPTDTVIALFTSELRHREICEPSFHAYRLPLTERRELIKINRTSGGTSMSQQPALTADQLKLNDAWEEHLLAEFKAHSADEAIATMVANPLVNQVPVMIGGNGKEELHEFYARYFLPQI